MGGTQGSMTHHENQNKEFQHPTPKAQITEAPFVLATALSIKLLLCLLEEPILDLNG
jgi:hypothetical protein